MKITTLNVYRIIDWKEYGVGRHDGQAKDKGAMPTRDARWKEQKAREMGNGYKVVLHRKRW